MANRSKRMPALKFVAGLLALSLVAAACGDSSGNSTSAGESSTTTAAPTTTAATGSTTTLAATTGANAKTGDSTADSSNVDLTRLTEGAQTGGTLRIGVEAETDGLNPTRNRFAASGYQMGYAVFEPLFTPGADGQIIPYLAESGTPSDDGMTFDIKLRPGITFTDGEPLNAAALVANIEGLLSDPLISLAVKPALNVDNPVEVVDDLTVRINLSIPNKHFSSGLTGQLGMPASPKWLAAALEDPTLNQEPVGTGPFVFESRTQDLTTKFVRNDNWWQTEQNGTPVYLDAIEFFINTDGETSASQLIAGALDGFGTTNTAAIATIRDEGDRFIRIDDDQGEESFGMMNSTVPPFDDIRARQAITFATPVKDFINFIGDGVLRPADTMFAPELIWNNPDVIQETDQPDRAAPLVESYCADFPENCTNGRINFKYSFSGPSVQNQDAYDVLSAGWGKYFNVESDMILQDAFITSAAFGKFQMIGWRQFGAVDPTADRVWLACDSIGGLSLNWPRFCDPARDEILNAAQASTDLNERVALYKELQQKIHDDYLYVFYARTLWMQAFDARVKNECGALSPDGAELLCTNNGSMFNYSAWIDQG